MTYELGWHLDKNGISTVDVTRHTRELTMIGRFYTDYTPYGTVCIVPTGEYKNCPSNCVADMRRVIRKVADSLR